MLEQTELFFTTLFGKEIDMNILYAVSVCIVFLLIYGILIRPFLSLANGKKGRPLFDIVVIGLVLMIGFKLLYPGFLVKDGYTEDDLEDYWEQGYSAGKDYGEMISWDSGYKEGYADALKDYNINTETPDNTEEPDDTTVPDDSNEFASVEEYFASIGYTFVSAEQYFSDPDADYKESYLVSFANKSFGGLYVEKTIFNGYVYTFEYDFVLYYDDSYTSELHINSFDFADSFEVVAQINGRDFYRVNLESVATVNEEVYENFDFGFAFATYESGYFYGLFEDSYYSFI